MASMSLSRRAFIRKMVTAFYGIAFFSGLWPRPAAAESKTSQKKVSRPPGTCGGWTDKNHNGYCDRSEKGQKSCNAIKCPGHKNNLRRQAAKENKAPLGSCALWEDSDKKGTCAISIRSDNPCAYEVCPAHGSKTNSFPART